MASSLSLAVPLKPPSPLSAQALARPRFALGSPRCDFAGKVGNGSLVIKRARTSDVRGLAVAGVDGVRVPVAERKEERPIIVIDNYDSFTYNLCQYMGELGASFEVYRNDEITVEEMRSKNPRGILISPGPGTPKDSGISLQTVLELGPSIPLFGVCMGLQCIGEAFGGNVVRSPSGVVHGKSSLVYYDEKLEDTVFSGLPNPFTAARYHSLVIEKNSFPGEILEITAWTEDGLIMAARHKEYRHIQYTDGKTTNLPGHVIIYPSPCADRGSRTCACTGCRHCAFIMRQSASCVGITDMQEVLGVKYFTENLRGNVKKDLLLNHTLHVDFSGNYG